MTSFVGFREHNDVTSLLLTRCTKNHPSGLPDNHSAVNTLMMSLAHIYIKVMHTGAFFIGFRGYTSFTITPGSMMRKTYCMVCKPFILN